MHDKEKTRVAIVLDSTIWRQIKAQAALKGETIHKTVGRILKEAIKEDN